MVDEATAREARRLVAATPAAGGTSTVAAVRRGLAFRPEVLFLVTDGDDVQSADLRAIQAANPHGTIIHTTREWPTVIGAGCVVGHRAHLEGCVVEDGCLIGSGSLVLNRARVEAGAVVAAAALIREDMVVPAGALAMGVPATIRADAGRRQAERIASAVQTYLGLAARHRAGTRRIHP